MNEQNVYTYNDILSSHKKECNFDMCYNMMDFENIMLK